MKGVTVVERIVIKINLCKVLKEKRLPEGRAAKTAVTKAMFERFVRILAERGK